MNKILFILFTLLLSTNLYAQDSDELCGYFKFCGSSSPSKNSVNTSTSSILNPSNLAKIKGLGLETLYQKNNPFGFSIVTGNGRVGAALISPTLENSFFGIRSLELDVDYYYRYLGKLRYKNKKINLATGVSLIQSKNFSLELGLSARRNPDIKKINPGIGISSQLAFLSFGAYVYKDDVKVNFNDYLSPTTGISYATTYGASTYQESYTVTTLNMGVQIKNLSLDVANLSTKYKFYNQKTNIFLYTAAYRFRKVLFNYGIRNEESPNYFFKDNTLINQPAKTFNYYGIQYIPTKHVMIGAGYNTFLTNEISVSLTLFLN